MKHQNVSSIAKNVGRYISKNKSNICRYTGITLCVGATVSGVLATIKAVKKVNGKELTKAEKFKAVWYYYIPAVTAEAFGVAFIIGSSKMDAKQHATLAAAYSMTTAAFNEYKEKVIETIGEKEEEGIKDGVMRDKVDRSVSKEVYVATNGDTLFYEPISDTLFVSSIYEVRKGLNNFNRDMLSEDSKAFNELAYEFGLKGLKTVGDEIGWNINDGYIDIRFVGHISEDMRPCLALEYNIEPKYGFNNLY